MKYEEWLEKVEELWRSTTGINFDDIEKTWWQYYFADDYTPQETVSEELNNWDVLES